MHTKKIDTARKIDMARIAKFILGATFTLVAAVSALLWLDGSKAIANNPPTTALGTANVDPAEAPPTGAIGTASTPVYESLEANGLFYIVGDFITVGGEPRRSVAAIDVATGQVDPTFAPVILNSAEIVDAIAISPDGADLYIGGRFTNVNGTFRARIAKLDAITGALDTTFNANINAQVDTIATDGNSVWVGGNFGTVNGVSAPNLVKLNATTGALDGNWVGTADARVRDVELDVNNVLWAGGNFDNIGGSAVSYLAPLNSSTGTVLGTWSPGLASHNTLEERHPLYVVSPAPDGSAIYVGTRGTPSASPQGGNAVRKYATDGELLWQKIGAGDTQALEATNTTVYAGGHGNFVYTEARYNLDGTMNTNFVGGTAANPNGFIESDANPNATRRNKLWALDAATGDLTGWNPDLDSTDGVWGLESGPSGLQVGGDFRNIVNPSGTAGPAVFAAHFAVFVGEGAGGNTAPEALFTIDCATTQCNVDASTSLDDGSITSYAWDFGNGQTATGQQASATLADDTTHDITLTVTDNSGQTDSLVQKVAVGSGGLPIEHIATATKVSNFTSVAEQIPAIAQANDVAIAFVSVSQSAAVVTAPAGWVQFGDETDGNLRTFGFWKALTASDPNSNQIFPLSIQAKNNLTLSVFRGVDPTNPIAAEATTATTQRTAEHTAPSLSFTGDATTLHYWAERTSDTTEIFASPDLATLSTAIGSLAGRVNSTLAINPVVATSSSPASTAITEHHSTNALGWSVALLVAPDNTDPEADVTTPAAGSTTTPGTIQITGNATDDNSGIDRVLVQIRRLTTPREYWNGTTWTTTPRWNTATLNGNGTNVTWTLPNVNFDQTGDHQIVLNVRDNANNIATSTENPITSFTIG